ncbi:hypothetical protein GEMRC1_010814 [Eukaryota sp. GEM-RC1]
MIRSIAAPNNVTVYNVTAGKTMPQFARESRTNSLRKDDSYRRRVDLLQDFTFPTASSCIKLTNDKHHLIAAGTYPPQIRTWEFDQLSLKFQRNLDHEVVTFEVLQDDWKKLAILREDRFIEFHSQGGYHFKTRVPRPGRSLAYHQHTAELLVVGSSSDVYRLNLEQGRFMAPFSSASTGLNVVKICPAHQLIMTGSEDGFLIPFDPRDKTRLQSHLVESSGLTSLSFHENGINLAVGTAAGNVYLYDLRSDKPLFKTDMRHESMVHSVDFHGSKIVAADHNSVRLFDFSGIQYTAFEPPVATTSMTFDDRTGVLFFAAEQERCLAYYIPSLGPAPSWCSYLDNITEEMEESTEVVQFDDFKFVTKDELEELGLMRLIGTGTVRSYLHGYYVDMKTWRKARAVMGFSEEFKKKRIEEEVEKEQRSKVKVGRKVSGDVDNRFSSLLNDDDFKVDQHSTEQVDVVEEEYVAPVTYKKDKKKKHSIVSVSTSKELSKTTSDELRIPLKDRLSARGGSSSSQDRRGGRGRGRGRGFQKRR